MDFPSGRRETKGGCSSVVSMLCCHRRWCWPRCSTRAWHYSMHPQLSGMITRQSVVCGCCTSQWSCLESWNVLQVVTAAVEQHWMALQYMSCTEAYIGCRPWCCPKHFRLCFRRLPQVKWQWRYNFELVETLSSPTWLYVSFPPSLRYASDELRDDMDIALIAVKSNGLALDQAGRGRRVAVAQSWGEMAYISLALLAPSVPVLFQL